MFTLYNLKGGTGKTVISTNLALTLGYGLVTNDPYSPVDDVIENCLKLTSHDTFPDIPNDAGIIIDLGGHVDKTAVEALKKSSVVLIPVLNDYPTLKTTVRFTAEITELNSNIAFIVNRTKKGDFKFVEKALKLSFDYPVFEIKESASLPSIFHEKESIHSQVSKGGLKKYSYEPVKQQFDVILDFLKKYNEHAERI